MAVESSSPSKLPRIYIYIYLVHQQYSFCDTIILTFVTTAFFVGTKVKVSHILGVPSRTLNNGKTHQSAFLMLSLTKVEFIFRVFVLPVFPVHFAVDVLPRLFQQPFPIRPRFLFHNNKPYISSCHRILGLLYECISRLDSAREKERGGGGGDGTSFCTHLCLDGM